ncbi:MAG TPA: tetratricopeptide repeat protein [Stellaceae bacterium]|jgi:predicted O-linked N-acetylglucosamine transferase (SPINDLY family)|nr:tetratricopeptide repeat protein [Stellaceae bacterium]
MSGAATWLSQALQLHEAGRLAEAEPLYRRVLAVDAHNAEALHLLGVLAHQTGRSAEARRLIARALEVSPDNASYHNNFCIVLLAVQEVGAAISHAERALVLAPGYVEAFNNLGNALKAAHRLDEAADAYRSALRLKPDYVDAWYNFAILLQVQGKFDQAIEVYQHVLGLQPGYVNALINLGSALNDAGRPGEAIEIFERLIQGGIADIRVLNNLGNAYKSHGRPTDAIACFHKALTFDPANAAVLNNLGNALQKVGDIDGAIETYGRVLAANPAQVESLSNLGNALQMCGRLGEAIDCYTRALAIEPDAVKPMHNLGMALRKCNRLGEAEAHFARALALKPDYVEAVVGLGSALETQGRMAEAIPLFRRALMLDPDFPEALAHLLFALSSHPGTTPAALRQVTELGVAAWPQPAWQVPVKRSDPAGRLRIGYVSADLRSHPVGHFLGGVLRAHDRTQVEVFCYWAGWVADEVTDRLKRSVDQWRDVAPLDDAALAALIAQDGIDVLVDLAGHTAEHRLSLFMARAAPVQASWLGFFGTTGIAGMDYLIADPVIIPPGEEAHYTEEVVRLPGCYLSFDSEGADVPVMASPEARNGFITFGCFNRRDKITAETIVAWCAILEAVPGSRLLVKNGAMADDGVAAALAGMFAGQGVGPDRLTLEGPVPRLQYLADYGRIDIALDPFPFCGGTTTAETLWMGVPLVTLRGATWAGRISASMLTVCGHAELVAEDVESYRRIAVELAQDTTRRNELRAGLRDEATRHLCDAEGFTRDLEAAYRRMVGSRI